MNNNVLGIESKLLREMFNPQINAMGLGVHLKGAERVLGYWHSGNNAGYTGMFFGINSNGQGAVVLTNSNAGEWIALEIIRSIANAYHWPIMRSISEIPIKDTKFHTGLYKVGDKDALLVTQGNGLLYFNKPGLKTSYRLYASSDGSFRMKEKPDNLKFVFRSDSSGTTNELIMYENAGNKQVMAKSKN